MAWGICRGNSGNKIDNLFDEGVSRIGTFTNWTVSDKILTSPYLSSNTTSECLFSDIISLKENDVLQIRFSEIKNNGYSNTFSIKIGSQIVLSTNPSNSDIGYPISWGYNATNDISGTLSISIANGNSGWHIQAKIISIKIIRGLNK